LSAFTLKFDFVMHEYGTPSSTNESFAVAAVLYARSRLDGPATPLDRRITQVWIALYFWLMVNSTVARVTHLNLSVLLLTALATLLARRATGCESAGSTASEFPATPLAATA